MRNLSAVAALCLLCLQHAVAEPYVPPELAPWKAWVLEDVSEHDCPYLHGLNNRHCLWITGAHLNLDRSGGRFKVSGTAQADSWLPLPGSRANWPVRVALGADGSPVPVIEQQGRPAIRVAAGPFEVTGAFVWQRLPNALALPASIGLVDLVIDDEPVPVNRDARGQLWLRDRAPASTDETRDRLDIKVHRKVTDLIPIRLETHLVLDVAGRQREVILPAPLLADYIPIRLTSPLPARIEPDGSLRLQVRPGHWEIRLLAYRPGDVTSVKRPPAADDWPEDEVWVFQGQNHLRLVEPTGVPQVDPRQTTLPNEWHSLPAFLVGPGKSLQLTVKRRGDPEPEPDRLSLNRTLWLDFNGGGYTVQDQLTGTITRTWRLEADPLLALGRVAVDGNNQLVTRSPDSDNLGVEVRRGQLDLTADSRYVGERNRLPLGWRHDLNSARATLHLPPGWDLFSVAGVDNNPPSWVQRWTLLDLFLVLIASIAITKLWGAIAGALALAALAITWHAPGAPHQVWLHLIVALALLRVVPKGRLRVLVASYRNLALLTLALVAIPFMVQQARTGIYPQLGDGHYAYRAASSVPASKRAAKRQARPAAPAELMEEARQTLKLGKAESYGAGVLNQALDFQRIDPKANVQTGPGLPRWQWRQIPLNWSGPVGQGQTVELTLLSPSVNRLIHFLRILLILSLAVILIRDRSPGGPREWLSGLGIKRETGHA